MKLRRLLAMLITLAMCLGLLPATALAEVTQSADLSAALAEGATVETGEDGTVRIRFDETAQLREADDRAAVPVSAPAGGETDTKNGKGMETVQIGTYEELLAFAARVNSGFTMLCAELTADIDASASNPESAAYTAALAWTPIGTDGNRYSGTFDGKGKVITGLYFNDSSAENAGLFGIVSAGTVKNVGIAGGSITGWKHVGGVVGFIDVNESTVQNCYNTGSVSGTYYVGGVAGNAFCAMENCFNTGSVSGSATVGGVTGHFSSGTMQNCYNTGSVTGSGDYVGGVTGAFRDGTIQTCYNAGSVTGSGSTVGGVVGKIFGNNATVKNCYYDKDLAGDAVTGALGGADDETNSVTGLNTTQMTGAAAMTNMAGFDASVWTVVGAYPRLADPYAAPTLAALSTDPDGNYLINSTADWNTLAELVYAGADTSGVTFTQTADFTVSAMLGKDQNTPFRGTYDGGGHTLTLALEDTTQICVAPFHEISGATIRNLKVAGTVTGTSHSAGLVGAVAGGVNTIENCVVSAAVTAGASGDNNGKYCGGFVGHGRTYTVSIKGCVFDGELKAVGDGYTSATFFGWGDGVTVTMKDCLDLSDSAYPIGLGAAASADSISVTNCYYAADKQQGQVRPWANAGARVYTVTAGAGVSMTVADTATKSYEVSDLSFYETGVLCGGVLYAGAGESVALNLTYIGAGVFTGFAAGAGTLTESGGIYTLTMPAQNVTVGMKTAGYPLWIGCVQFTSDNLTVDGTDDPAITSGTAVYDPAANTLTLTDFVWSGEGSYFDQTDGYSALCYLGTDDFTVELIGASSMTMTGTTAEYQEGVRLTNDSGTRNRVTFFSPIGGSLSVTAGTSTEYSSSGFVSTYSDVELSGVELDVRGGSGLAISGGLYLDRQCSLTLLDSKLTAAGGQAEMYNSRGIMTFSTLTVDNSTLIAVGGTANLSSYGIHGNLNPTVSVETGGMLIAKDYPSYGDIGVEMEWARWAMDVIVAHSALE